MARTNTNTGGSAVVVTDVNGLTGSVIIGAGDNITFTPNGNGFDISAPDDAVLSVNGQTGVVVLDTDDIAEGVVNFYWTQPRFDAAFAAKDTDDLDEGGLNLYFTDARAIAANTGQWVALTGNETIFDVKTFDEFITLPGTMPVLNTDAVNKLYADAIALGFRFKQSVQAATTSPLAASTYNNGASGVGATLTANANGAIADIDTYVVQLGDRLLIKDQSDPIENGIYVVTDVGDGSNPWILTRADDFDSTLTIGQGSACLVLNGTAYNPPATTGNYASQFAVLTADPITVGSDQIIWSRISLPLQYFAGTGLTLVGTTFSADPIYSPFNIANSTTIYSSGLSGTGTGNGTGHNFFSGVSAGFSATNVDNGIFIGHFSGSGATNANNGVFLGQNTGMNAVSAFDAVFIGNGAGFNAASASGGVFIGRDAGSGATNADGSIFLGSGAGGSATSASHLIAIGPSSGNGATNADNGIFLGESSGQNAATAYDAIFIGTNSGKNDTVNNPFGSSSIAIGSNSGTGGFSNSIALGANAVNTSTNQFLIGSTYTKFSMRGVSYTMPSANGSGSLVNDGSGNLTWGAASSQFQFLRNATALTRTSNTTLTLVPSMTATVTGGKIYQFTATLFTTSGTGGGVKAAITLAGGATGTIIYQGETIQNATAITSSRATAQNTAVGAVTNVTAGTIHITGTFVCSVSGLMRVTFGQNVSNATSSVVLANSIFQVTQIN